MVVRRLSPGRHETHKALQRLWGAISCIRANVSPDGGYPFIHD
jgi:hypothetical protein